MQRGAVCFSSRIGCYICSCCLVSAFATRARALRFHQTFMPRWRHLNKGGIPRSCWLLTCSATTTVEALTQRQLYTCAISANFSVMGEVANDAVPYEDGVDGEDSWEDEHSFAEVDDETYERQAMDILTRRKEEGEYCDAARHSYSVLNCNAEKEVIATMARLRVEDGKYPVACLGA